MSELIEVVKRYREDRHKVERRLEAKRQEITKQAHEMLSHMEDHEEFVEALNFIYWEATELQVAPIQCSTGLRYGDFRSYIKPHSTGRGCQIDGCQLEYYVQSRTKMPNSKKGNARPLLCPGHYQEWFYGAHRDRWPIIGRYLDWDKRYPHSYENGLWMLPSESG